MLAEEVLCDRPIYERLGGFLVHVYKIKPANPSRSPGVQTAPRGSPKSFWKQTQATFLNDTFQGLLAVALSRRGDFDFSGLR